MGAPTGSSRYGTPDPGLHQVAFLETGTYRDPSGYLSDFSNAEASSSPAWVDETIAELTGPKGGPCETAAYVDVASVVGWSGKRHDLDAARCQPGIPTGGRTLSYTQTMAGVTKHITQDSLVFGTGRSEANISLQATYGVIPLALETELATRIGASHPD